MRALAYREPTRRQGLAGVLARIHTTVLPASVSGNARGVISTVVSRPVSSSSWTPVVLVSACT